MEEKSLLSAFIFLFEHSSPRWLSDINEELFAECLFTPSSPDLLIRTSGERRLSDFMVAFSFSLSLSLNVHPTPHSSSGRAPPLASPS
jgi:undecaprenyl diphosphate synthase